MSRTIVQEYGPIYGEPVNGTVMGRPNGSVYVPISNTIDLSLAKPYMTYLLYLGNTILVGCESDGTIAYDSTEDYYISANSQDLSSYIRVEGFSDAALTTSIGWYEFSAGLFSVQNNSLLRDVDTSLTDGDKIYLRAQLMNNGVPVATSSVIEITVVIP